MAKIIVKFKDATLREVPLAKSTMTIGRVDQNDIRIKNLAVSREHARITLDGSRYVLEDLNSMNGTFVNDKQVTKCILKHRDEILVGKHILVFSEEEGNPNAINRDIDIPLTEKTVILDTRNQRKLTGKPEEEGKAIMEMPAEYKGGIMILAGGAGQKNITLTRRITIAGKGKDADIRLKGFFIGKPAFIISRRLDGFFITHSGGMCMTKVNGEEVTEERALNDGDIITVGSTRMKFFISK